MVKLSKNIQMQEKSTIKSTGKESLKHKETRQKVSVKVVKRYTRASPSEANTKAAEQREGGRALKNQAEKSSDIQRKKGKGRERERERERQRATSTVREIQQRETKWTKFTRVKAPGQRAVESGMISNLTRKRKRERERKEKGTHVLDVFSGHIFVKYPGASRSIHSCPPSGRSPIALGSRSHKFWPRSIWKKNLARAASRILRAVERRKTFKKKRGGEKEKRKGNRGRKGNDLNWVKWIGLKRYSRGDGRLSSLQLLASSTPFHWMKRIFSLKYDTNVSHIFMSFLRDILLTRILNVKGMISPQ